MNTRLLLARHGQTAWNAEGRFMGQLDVPLDETGRAQVQALARRLSLERPQMIYASDLQRAQDTALAIQSALGTDTEIRLEPRLREMHFGDWQGQTYAEIKQRDPEALAAWESGRTDFAPPKGETLTQFAVRVRAAYTDICLAQPEQTVIVAAHGGSLQLLIVQSLGMPPATFWQLRLSNASLSELRAYESGTVLYLLNDTSHLSAAA
jgi:alpha-ribazole phosphatase